MTIHYGVWRSASRSTKHLILVTRRCYSIQQLGSLTSCSQLAELMSDPSWHKKTRIIDATWDLPQKDYYLDHVANRIPGAKFFDLEECRDKDSPYKMMLPNSDQFGDYVSYLGVSNYHHVVIYDNHPKHAVFSSPRLWWMFKLFGHDNVSILNGGLTTWIKEGYGITAGPYKQNELLSNPKSKFRANFRPELVRDFEFVKENAKSEDPVQLLESRNLTTLPVREDNTLDLSESSVPCAVWTPFNALLDAELRSVRTPSEIRDILKADVDVEKQPVTTCGRGVSASIVSFCAYYASGINFPVYDGSWSEWSSRSS